MLLECLAEVVEASSALRVQRFPQEKQGGHVACVGGVEVLMVMRTPCFFPKGLGARGSAACSCFTPLLLADCADDAVDALIGRMVVECDLAIGLSLINAA